MVGRIIIGLVLVAVGFLVVWKTEWINQNFGSIAWAEAKFGGSGGSRLLYKLIGLTSIFIGFLTVTNLHRVFFVAAFGWLFGMNQEPTL